MDENVSHVQREMGEYLNMIKHCGMIYKIVLGWEDFKSLES